MRFLREPWCIYSAVQFGQCGSRRFSGAPQIKQRAGPRLQQAEGPLHGGGGAGASLVERLGTQGGVEGVGLDRAVIVDLDQRTQEVLHRNDARGGRQLAVVIPVLIQRQADGSIVQVHGQHIRATQRQQVLVRLFRVEPVPAIELNAKVVRTDSDDQLLHLAHGVYEGMSLAPQKSARRNILQAELLAVVGENLRALAQAVGVLAEVLRVCEVITARENPGADAPHAGSLQDVSHGREIFQSVVKSRLILAKLHRQNRSAESEILRPQIVKETLEPIIAQRSEVVRIRIQAFETVLDGEFERLRETGLETKASEAQNRIELTPWHLSGRGSASEYAWGWQSCDACRGSDGEELASSELVGHSRLQAVQCSTCLWRNNKDRVARNVVREMSIGENYEGNITPFRSDISRFSRGTGERLKWPGGIFGRHNR